MCIINSRNLFLTVLEAEKPKMKVSVDSVSCESPLSWFVDGCLLTVSSHDLSFVCTPFLSLCVSKFSLVKRIPIRLDSVQFSSAAQSCPTLCNPMYCSMPGLPVHHQLPESTQAHVHWVGDAIQPFHPLSSPSPPALNRSQPQSLFKWISSLHQVAKVLEFQLQHQSFQWTPRTDFL